MNLSYNNKRAGNSLSVEITAKSAMAAQAKGTDAGDEEAGERLLQPGNVIIRGHECNTALAPGTSYSGAHLSSV